MYRLLPASLATALFLSACGSCGTSHTAPAGGLVAEVALSPSEPLPADGIASAEVAVRLTDAAGAPLASVEIEIEVGGGGNRIEAPAPTDGSGRTHGKIASTEAGEKQLRIHAHWQGADHDLGKTWTLTFVAGAPARLAVQGLPSQLRAGVPFGLQVVASDAHGNRVGSTLPVEVAVEDGELLGQTTGATGPDGVARFDGLRIERSGEALRLVVTAGELSPVFSEAFSVQAADAARLKFLDVLPAAVAGAPLDPIEVGVVDEFGNPSDEATLVTLSLPEAPEALVGERTARAEKGVARFEGLAVERAGGALRLVAAADGLAPVEAEPFAVAPAPADSEGSELRADHAAFVAGTSLGLELMLRDRFGNPLSGAEVVFSAGDEDVFLPADRAVTDEAGVARVSFGSIRAEPKRVSALSDGIELELALAVLPAAPAPEASLKLGGGQTGVVGEELAAPVGVILRDAFDNAVPGIAVSFEAGGAVVATVVSDNAGRAEHRWRLGGSAGVQQLLAWIPGAAEPITLEALAAPAAPAATLVGAGDGQTGTVGTTLAGPLVVHVADGFGNPVPGASVDFVVVAGGGSLSVASGQTDAAGDATALLTLGTAIGRNEVEARIAGLAAARFVATAEAGPAVRLVAAAGDGQSVRVGESLPAPLTAEAQDEFGNPVGGVVVSFSLEEGGGTLAPEVTSSGADGRAESALTLGSVAGRRVVTATSPGLTSCSFSATGMVGPVAAVVAVAGDDQTGVVGTAVAAPLVVEVRDDFGNPVEGVNVAFTATDGGSVAPAEIETDEAGRAATVLTRGTVAGLNEVTASVAGVAGVARFVSTGTAGAPAQLASAGGEAQSVVAGTAAGAPFRVRVSDAFGNPVAGVAVSFAVEQGGGLVGPVAQTDTDGEATASWTAGLVAGPASIRATVAGISGPLDFSATIVPAAPASSIALSSLQQQAMAGSRPGEAFSVEVRDAYGNPVPGVDVSFRIAGGDGTLDLASVTTGGDGRASTGYTCGTTVGSAQVEASIAGLPGLVSFAVDVVAGPAAQLVASSGGGGTDPVGSSRVVSVQVLDAFGNAVSGTPVDFAVVTGDAVVDPARVDSSPSGEAASSLLVGTTPGAIEVHASSGSLAPAIFQLTSVPGAPATLVSVSSPAAASAGGSFAAWVIKVVDAHGNGVPSVPVAFSVVSGPAFVGSSSAATDAAGEALAHLEAGTVTGPVTVEARAGSLTLELHSSVGAAAPARIVDSDGPGRVGVVGKPLALHVIVEDAFGNPVGATEVSVVPLDGGFVLATSVTTGADGAASIDFTPGTVAGRYRVSFVAGGAAQTTAVDAGADVPASITAVAGNGQSGTPGHALASPLRVRVADVHGNPVAATRVSFQAEGGGSFDVVEVGTDAAGLAEARYTPGPSYGSGVRIATASVIGDSSIAPAGFQAHVNPNPAVRLVAVSGDGQAGSDGVPLGQPFVARAEDSFGYSIPGVSVSFLVVSGAANLSVGVAVTGADGTVATLATPTAGGVLSVTANSAGVLPASFSATVTAGTLVRISGNNLLGYAGSTGGAPLVARVVDGLGNGIAGKAVAFAVVSGDAFVANTSFISDADGYARTTVTLGAAPGSAVVRASISGSSVDFAVQGRGAAAGMGCHYLAGGALRTLDAAELQTATPGVWRLYADLDDWSDPNDFTVEVQLLLEQWETALPPAITAVGLHLKQGRSASQVTRDVRFFAGGILDLDGTPTVVAVGGSIELFGMATSNPTYKKIATLHRDAPDRWRIRYDWTSGSFDEITVTESDGRFTSVLVDAFSSPDTTWPMWGLCGNGNGNPADDATVLTTEAPRSGGRSLFP